MRDLFFFTLFCIYIFRGFSYPFVAGLGYLWVDLVTPQGLAFSFMKNRPLSMMMALFLIFSFLINRKKKYGGDWQIVSLIVVFSIWVTLTTTWAEVPSAAWWKWDWAFKGLIFAAFMPFLFRTRFQVEAALYTMIFSVGSFFILYGAKTLLGGGSYGNFTGGNSGLEESSFLALVCIMLIPIILFLKDHSAIFPQGKVNTMMHWGFVVLCLLTTVGTFARTGLMAAAALVFFNFMDSSKKLRYVAIVGALFLLAASFVPQDWISRMSTITEYEEESSALGRLAVWQWTIDYVNENPLGGGFRAYLINGGEYKGLIYEAKAYHSIYFEVLGCHGYPGLFIFLLLFALVLGKLHSVKKKARSKGHYYYSGLARSIMVTIGIFLVGASFIGVAFQPLCYYFVAMGVSAVNLWKNEQRVPKNYLAIKRRPGGVAN